MRILLIDDEKVVRDMLCQHLRAESFAVDLAEDGTEGSYLARTNNYDLIILDNMLPEKSGRTVCQEIRRVGLNVPILMLSRVSTGCSKDKPTELCPARLYISSGLTLMIV